jgi:xanthine dehydrogenase accessory factor
VNPPFDLRRQAQAWHAAGRAAVVVAVSGARGSVPRDNGTRMLVAADEVVGTIGGGHLELQAIQHARQLLAESVSARSTRSSPSADTPVPRLKHIALGPSLGQCCGGALDLSFDLLAASQPADWPPSQPKFSLQLYGAGHVGRAIVQVLMGIDCQVQWIDERESEFPNITLPAHIQRLCVEPVQAEVAAAPAGAFYLVMTHSHDVDLAISQAIFKRADFAYFGLIGSATKRARFEHRLAERGVAAELLSRLVCPIGVPGIPGKEPEVIAVAVVAQILAQAGAPSGP